MPTYQYKCTKCGHEFEEFQSMNDKPLETCPKCGGKPERIISGGAGFLFKGSGFYITDHRSKAYKEAAGNETGGAVVEKSDKSKKETTSSAA
ncbi:MAG: zinc ribbon domain-containing protein [candidate division Zixibacteria bacterium]|nr:zinc ribbon domain-containing protein [candidate division Zixibacteria bacterium]